jgi:hypothetical protein
MGVISKYKNLGHSLKLAFPELKWNLEKFSKKGKKSIQGWYEKGKKKKLRQMKLEGREEYRRTKKARSYKDVRSSL